MDIVMDVVVFSVLFVFYRMLRKCNRVFSILVLDRSKLDKLD